MDTKEYLEANNIQYAKDCKQCELQEKCIECYNATAYRFWNEEPWEEEEDVELCHITGEECMGDPLFCEECPIMLDEEEP